MSTICRHKIDDSGNKSSSDRSVGDPIFSCDKYPLWLLTVNR
ncbi:hypothetical protein [Tolypothrix sp. PCC 7910]|nr:hypothetical protein [Tolypothrix sp. PCC 7910]